MTTDSSYVTYPLCKDSEANWLQNVPGNWDAARLKRYVENITDFTSGNSSEGTYIALEHVESWTGKVRTGGNHNNSDSQVKRFQAGDVLFGRLRPYLAKVTAPTKSGSCVGEFLVLRPIGDQFATNYLERLLRSKPIIDAIDASTFGAKMPRANWNFIGNMEMPVPPLEEQAAIVRFLDHADEQIERLIALLEEQRQALIH